MNFRTTILLTSVVVLTSLVSSGESIGQLELDVQQSLEISNAESTLIVQITERRAPNNPVSGVLCNLYLTEISREGMMGSLISDVNGTASFLLVNKFYEAKKNLNEYQFIVRVANDQRFVSQDDTTVFRKSESHSTEATSPTVSKWQKTVFILLLLGVLILMFRIRKRVRS